MENVTTQYDKPLENEGGGSNWDRKPRTGKGTRVRATTYYENDQQRVDEYAWNLRMFRMVHEWLLRNATPWGVINESPRRACKLCSDELSGRLYGGESGKEVVAENNLSTSPLAMAWECLCLMEEGLLEANGFKWIVRDRGPEYWEEREAANRNKVEKFATKLEKMYKRYRVVKDADGWGVVNQSGAYIQALNSCGDLVKGRDEQTAREVAKCFNNNDRVTPYPDARHRNAGQRVD